MSTHKATRYETPNGKERHVDESLRNAFDYLITMWDGTVSSGKMNMVQVEEVGVYQTNLDYLSARLFYCTDEMPPDVVELLGRFDINIDEQYAIYGYTYAAAAHAFVKILFFRQRGTINDLGKPTYTLKLTSTQRRKLWRPVLNGKPPTPNHGRYR